MRTPQSLAGVLSANFRGVSLSSLETFGRVVALALEAVVGTFTDLFTRRFQWAETTRQCWFMITVTAIPAVLMAIPFGVVVSIQIGNLIKQLGADSLLGAAGGIGVIQQGAPLTTGLLLGGAGTATIAADLGARTIREEIDALRTMGINPVHRLVIPRMVAMLFVAPLLNILIIFVGVGAGYAVAIGPQGVTPGSYWETFGAFASPTDVVISIVKALIFGFLVVIIGCQRGLEARGGPRGVAEGVNASVVLSVVAIMIVNVLITQLTTMFHPMQVA
ncbi:ABC transporter permease [Rhodococcus sp. G-MC3]|uniref:MlaE family ABC transporter permease n=1 Tax=Rhodococcus sp. G-MC3 TaxID=3046209 RepID=UPI0024BB0B51|nr:ABC transporter permease [Rhodococcus sp. G-MC3]MDJ0392667.1 ABC transporter permease [Rhodococcus sp. G-MC3]